MTNRFREQNGATLIEVLVAGLVLTSAVFAMADLFLAAAGATTAARQTTTAATLGAQKLEQVLSTSLAVTPESVDYTDASGRVVTGAAGQFPDAVYTRQWSIEALTADTFVVRVRVGLSERSGRSRRVPGDVHLLTIRQRTAP